MSFRHQTTKRNVTCCWFRLDPTGMMSDVPVGDLHNLSVMPVAY
ncbi:hypothetical protein RBSWK_06472 [Rhodopirellula baltica SWK14]|uniref:Uncharacterized protein n=1 Tax=Rhodopirellula baltica SWK14 TaxID=993516 RepID=L7C935_RHOBT|nr:hypothetical protein RBSWK_06472 [Rhodopirellula baltica SWK14]